MTHFAPTHATQRSADASIRGYFFQIVWTARQWLKLGPDELLRVEGEEDLDHAFVDENGQVLRDFHQLKDLSANHAPPEASQRAAGRDVPERRAKPEHRDFERTQVPGPHT